MAETKRHRGFAAMDPEQQRAIASQGGKAAHAKGTAHTFSVEKAREAGRKGGQALRRNRAERAGTVPPPSTPSTPPPEPVIEETEAEWSVRDPHEPKQKSASPASPR